MVAIFKNGSHFAFFRLLTVFFKSVFDEENCCLVWFLYQHFKVHFADRIVLTKTGFLKKVEVSGRVKLILTSEIMQRGFT